jgi:CNT family concentrative nucleoside transporter
MTILKTQLGRDFFEYVNGIIIKLLDFTTEGSKFVFGPLVSNAKSFGFIFAFQVLPTIIFFSSLMTVLYHIGFMQWIVKWVAIVMAKTMKTSGAESLSASANIFVGQTEAPLVIKPYVAKMTVSELMAVMTGGMATVAGGVMAAYVGMLKDTFPSIAGHLLAASIMSAPAALVMAKLIVPETEQPVTAGEVKMKIEKPDVNVIDAAARGAGEGLQLALNVAAMLLAFIALIAMLNYGLFLTGEAYNWLVGKDSHRIYVYDFPSQNLEELKGAKIEVGLTKARIGELTNKFRFVSAVTKVEKKGKRISIYFKDGLYAPSQKVKLTIKKKGHIIYSNNVSFMGAIKLNMEIIFGFLLAPLAWLMGVPWKEAGIIGNLFGEKTVLNEFIAYSHLSQLLHTKGLVLSKRSVVIASYALCGFANFGSIAIQLGGIGGLAPNRRHDLAKLGLKSLIGGTLAAFMTATIAGMLI